MAFSFVGMTAFDQRTDKINDVGNMRCDLGLKIRCRTPSASILLVGANIRFRRSIDLSSTSVKLLA